MASGSQQKTYTLVLGMGGFGRQLGELLAADGRFGQLLFLDDTAPKADGCLADCENPEFLRRAGGKPAAFVALGNSELRLQWLQRLEQVGCCLPVFCHTCAVVSPSASLGAGTVILPFAYVGAGATIGRGCIVNAGAIVDHDASLGDGVHAAPGAIIKAGAQVAAQTKVESGQVICSPWEKG